MKIYVKGQSVYIIKRTWRKWEEKDRGTELG